MSHEKKIRNKIGYRVSVSVRGEGEEESGGIGGQWLCGCT